MLRGFLHRPDRRMAHWFRSALVVSMCALTAALLVAGCENGVPPFEVVGGDSSPDYLPPDGISPGTTSFFDSLYVFDGAKYSLFDPQPATPFELIKRGKILAPVGASISQQIRPDLVDETLGSVYANPGLLGFVRAATGAPTDVFMAGPIIGDAATFYPIDNSSGVSRWFYNQQNFEWTRIDSLIGPDFAPDSQGAAPGQVWRLSVKSTVRANLRETFLPNFFSFDYLTSSVPGTGIFWHAYTIISERVEKLGEDGVPQPQRNPRSPWLSRDALGLSDPNTPVPSAIDQCLDALWGTLELHPVRLAGQLPGSPAGTPEGTMRVGDRISTWTYLAVDSDELAPRIGDPTAVPPIEPIAICAGAGVEVAPQFPTGTFSILMRYEAVIEDAYDFWEERGGQIGANALVGVYGEPNDGEIDVVKLVVTLWLGAPAIQPTERIEIYLQRGIGPVVYRTGVRVQTVLRARLRDCIINGQVFDPSFFQYQD